MVQVVWQFIVKPEAVASFEEAYGPAGAWSRLFRRHPGYQGTTLGRDTTDPRRYLTIDSWETLEQRAGMLVAAAAEYAELDRALADLTDSEAELGTFSTVPDRPAAEGGWRTGGGDPVAAAVFALVAAWNARDAEAFGALFTEQADYVSSGGTWHRGRGAIEGLLRQDAAAPPVSVQGSVGTRRHGDVGRAVFHWTAGEAPNGRRGVIGCVVVRQAGVWKVDALHNTPAV